MKNINKIKKEIEAIGFQVKRQSEGLNVRPHPDRANLIYTYELKRLLAVSRIHKTRFYINFDLGYVRLH